MAIKSYFTMAIEQASPLAKATLESSNDGVLVVTVDGEIIDFNKKLVSMWHIPAHVLEMRDQRKALEIAVEQLEDPVGFIERIKFLHEHPDSISIDILRFKDGRVFERHSHPYKSNDETIGLILHFRDVTKSAKLERKLQHQSTHDVLTGLPNRQLLFDRLRQAIASAKRDNTQVALLVFDLYRFKIINESLTHAVGDELLHAVAKRLKSVMREGDTLARLGGDEFVIVATHIEKDGQVAIIVRDLLGVINHPFVVSGREIALSASVGISIFPKDGYTADILLRNADAAVYRAKERGANRFEFYTTEMNSQSLARLEQEVQLRYALLHEQFVLYYQPQFNLMTGDIIGAEALLRWRHPEKGLLLPGEFIPLAEETGLIIPIGEWVLKTACLQTKRWQNAGYPFFKMGINMTAIQFKQPGIVETVRTILEETGLQANCLEVEITENAIINTQDIVNIISALKQLGVEISLDDFGTGFSSLSYLKKLPISRLKIDRSFIQHIPHSRDDAILVRAIIAISKAFGMHVLAEGVEKEEQIDFLKSEECYDVQGFYFSEPLSPDKFEDLISRRKSK